MRGKASPRLGIATISKRDKKIMAKKKFLTAARARKLLAYDPMKGTFIWRVTTSNRRKAGLTAGKIQKRKNTSHLFIGIDGNRYSAGQLAWLIMTGKWPLKMIDHADRDGLNNRWKNLRLANHSQNGINCTPRAEGRVKGYIYDKETGKYWARSRMNGRQVQIGSYSNPAAAQAAHIAWVKKNYGVFAP